MPLEYSQQVKIDITVKLRTKLATLPYFVTEFFRGINDITAPRTQLAYSYDLSIFFNFLVANQIKFKDIAVKDFTINDLKNVTVDDLEEYMEYLNFYVVNKEDEDGEVTTTEYTNDEKGKSRKLSALRTMFSYFYKKRKLDANPAELVDMPKIHDKSIVRLDVDEVAKLLDEIESGEKLSPAAQRFHAYNKKRDLALITTLLGTGMRVSECVGIDIRHINFDNNTVKVTRKGGSESILYFGEEVREVLLDYLKERQEIKPVEGNEQALFLSLQRKRINVRSVQFLVKKYSSLITLRKISPHKLRSTFGTNLYKETGDIYLVADILGHADVNTTRRHYADMLEDKRRQAANVIKLRNS